MAITLPEIVVHALPPCCKPAQKSEEILKTLPGANITEVPGKTDISIYGSKPHHTDIFYDGIKSGDARIISPIFFNNEENLTVLKGSHSFDSLGGSVLLKTPRGCGKPTTVLEAETGLPLSLHTSLNTKGHKKIGYNIKIGHVTTKGHVLRQQSSNRNPHQNTYVTGRFDIPLNHKTSLSLFSRNMIGTSHYDESDGTMCHQAKSLFMNRVKLKHQTRDSWTQKFSIACAHVTDRHDSTHRIFNSVQSSWTHLWQPHDKHHIQCRFYHEKEFLKQEDTHKHRHTLSVAASDKYSFTPYAFVEAGLKLDKATTFRTLGSYTIPTLDLTFTSGMKTSFCNPSLFQLYADNKPHYYGNPDLKPEKGFSWDAGFSKTYKRSTFGSTYFLNNISDLIVFDNNTYKNVNKSRAQGIENFFETRIARHLTLHIDHTYTNAVDLATEKPLRRQPQHKISGRLDYENTVCASVGFIHNGPCYDISYVSKERPVALSSYTIFYAQASYPLSASTTYFFRVENALDKKYESPADYRGKGFAIFAGIRCTLA